VLLHGSAPGSSGWTNFAGTLGALAPHFTVLAPDLPGWGLSQAVPPDQFDPVGAVEEFLAAHGIERVRLVGNSMGALVTLTLAARRPELVTRLVTLGAPALHAAPPDAEAPSPGLVQLLSTYADPSPEQMQTMLRTMVFDPDLVDSSAVQERCAAAAARPELLENFLAGFGRPGFLPAPTADDLGRITAPTLLVHGRDDRVVAPQCAEQLGREIPGSRVHLISRCGHLAQIEHADEVNALLHEFLTTPCPDPLQEN